MSLKAATEALQFWADSCPLAPAGVHAIAGLKQLKAIRHAARVLTNPMGFTTDEYVKASALLKELAEEAT